MVRRHGQSAASAQQDRQIRRIGFLMSYREGDRESEKRLAVFRGSLSQAGWVDGQTARPLADVPSCTAHVRVGE